MNRLRLLPVLLLASGCATVSSVPQASLRPGLEVFLDDPPAAVEGKRVGLITNHTGVDRQGRTAIDLLHASPAFDLVALFSPEHGIRGAAAPGESIASESDRRTGLPIHSLYGATREPTPEMLEGVEALVFDIQDVGARQYTYISTMSLAMRAAATKGIPFVVLDRPNPIGGGIVEGSLLDSRFSSFVGMHPIAGRHGMTVGELALLFNHAFNIEARLLVVPVEGWERGEWLDETGLPWIDPSPNIRSLEAAIHYPGTVLFEGTNLSEGRGTALPFHQTGAPWLRAGEVADSLNALGLPGVSFEAVTLAVHPSAGKYPGQTIPGVRFQLTDRESYRPVSTAVLAIDLIRQLHPGDFEWSATIDRLAGTDALRLAIEGGTLPALLEEWDIDARRFVRMRESYLLYR